MKKSVFTSLILFCTYISHAAVLSVTGLLTEYRQDPVGIDVKNPIFCWQIQAPYRSVLQTAYKIQVATQIELLKKNKPDLWSTDWVASDTSVGLVYKGKDLPTFTTVYWQVKVKDNVGNESDWSKPATFTTAALDPSQLKVRWIGFDQAIGAEQPNDTTPLIHARYLRKEFSLSRSVKKAYLVISGLGLYQAFINGKKVGNDVLSPGQTEFSKRVLYNMYDVTSYLAKNNAIGIVLGNGRWVNLRNNPHYAQVDSEVRFPKMFAQLLITYSDGSTQSLVTDTTWKLTSEGPIRGNNEYDGETYDATRDLGKWTQPGYKDATWLNARYVVPPKGTLAAQNNEPIRITETLVPKSITKTPQGTYLVDMGQNMVGWISIRFNERPGTKVTIRFAEILDENGQLYTANLRSAKAQIDYISAGIPNETYEPTFTYFGFRYFEISGLSTAPTNSDILGKVVHDDVQRIGYFMSSNKILNKIFENAYWGIRGNYRSFPTDCPQRDERLGWLGDRAMSSYGEAMLFRNITFYRKWLQDIKDAQNEEGVIPDVAPTYYKIYSDNVTWPSAYVLIPYFYYKNFGDIRIIAENYDSMKKWIEHLFRRHVSGYLISTDTYGDWCVPPEKKEIIHSQDPARRTSPLLLASSYLYFDLQIMSYYAMLLGKFEDRAFYVENASKIKRMINDVLYDARKKQYDNNSMTSSLLPLAFDIVPDSDRDALFDNLVSKLILDFNTHVGTGLIGAQWQMKTLTRHGRFDLALTMATQTDYPSWGYMIENGATTIWELWNGNTADPAMNSGNHVMLLGDVIPWLFEDVAGVQSHVDKVGFKQSIIRPELSPQLSYASASINTLYGHLATSWRSSDKSFELDVTVPGNTLAIVYVPADNEAVVSESGLKASDVPGIVYQGKTGGYATYIVGSGMYRFRSSAFSYPEYGKGKIYSDPPQFSIKDTLLIGGYVDVRISSSIASDTIRYTIDGTRVSSQSPIYTTPIKVSKPTLIQAAIFRNGKWASENSTMIDFYDPKVNGLSYFYYEGDYAYLPIFEEEKILRSGTVQGLDLKKVKSREDNWAVIFKGYLYIEKEDHYTFLITSDDGSRIMIDDSLVAVIDGRHAPQTAMGQVKLTAGYHALEVHFFEGAYGEFLKLEYFTKEMPRIEVPVSKYFISVPQTKNTQSKKKTN